LEWLDLTDEVRPPSVFERVRRRFRTQPAKPGAERNLPSLLSRTVERSWPQVQAELDAGRPSPLLLVTVGLGDPISANHFVLAYRYEARLGTSGTQIRLWVYDTDTPAGTPGCDDVRIGLILDPDHPELTHTLRGEVRGLVRLPYTPQRPPSP
jgi:hypothetical protein